MMLKVKSRISVISCKYLLIHESLKEDLRYILPVYIVECDIKQLIYLDTFREKKIHLLSRFCHHHLVLQRIIRNFNCRLV